MNRIRALAAVAPLIVLLGAGAGSFARVRPTVRTVTYRGYSVTIPRSWPVYNLAEDPHICVRFDRHALYLGSPGRDQQCPASAVGRTEAILIEPAARGVRVLATWLHDPRLVAAALHGRTAASPQAVAAPRPGPRARLAASGGAATSGGAAAAYTPAYYTGPGFDACNVPSAQQMSAWTSHSSYRAIGIYLGGTNAACPPATDPNLSPSWLSSQVAAGWHFIPTYVGLQAPSNSCGCAAINPSKASAEGTAAAEDAVNQAQSLDLPSGTPIYNDMEYYSRTPTDTSAVLGFLAAWTTELHARGYASGVYGNTDSAVADLLSKYGTSYPEPDDVWFANWDGQKTTTDPSLPSANWPSHQRLHQYRGGHNETHGGVTLDIDGDYLDGATANWVATGPAPPPYLSVAPTAGGETSLTASWRGLGLVRWEVLAGTSPSGLIGITSAALHGPQTKFAVRSDAPYFAIEAVGSSNQVLATSSPAVTPSHLGLFGRTVFVAQGSGAGRIPVGCYLTVACHITTVIAEGPTVLARTRAQRLRPGATGLLSVRLNAPGRALLAGAAGAELPVQVTLEDRSGTTAGARMVLVAFHTRGRGPARRLAPSPVVDLVGGTDFASVQGPGGILARCTMVSPCSIALTLSVGRLTIASTRPETVGGLELGYLPFGLTARGRQLLAHARGNQLAANVVLRCGTSTARGRVALVQYG